eukprot:16428-Heterococcus_DN1.PRE.2
MLCNCTDQYRADAVDKACEGADCVWHVAALVGPFHARHMYTAVNYDGSINVLNACRLVLAGTPSTRFDGNDIDGLSEDQLKYPKRFLQLYAESKAKGEQVSHSD